ncbi:MAG: hypothetical protein AAFR64_06845 [Pseudomonadota bacterium]
MNIPTIDVSTVPGLASAQGLFGSITQASASYDDSVVLVMVYVYDVLPPEAVG